MNFKKKVNGSWTNTPHYVHKTDTDTITTLPAVLYPTGSTATVGLKGQAVQSTTPTPDNPVMPNGTGERTAQLFDGEITGQDVGMGTNRYGFSIEEAGTYTIKITGDVENGDYCYARSYSNGEYSESFYLTTGSSKPTYTATISDGEKILVFNASSAQTKAQSEAKFARWKIMANTGSTPLPYEPWGIKIPISSAGQTNNIYLGEVESTRQIKKLVLDGTENWYISAAWKKTNTSVFYFTLNNMGGTSDYESYIVSTHLPSKSRNELYSNDVEGIGKTGSSAVTIRISDTIATTVPELKTWLSQNNVSIWYVLSTATTGTVNEPLMKIGGYADTVSDVSIPVTAGGDTLSVGTTVQPSEVTVNYKGWHSVADVHERDNGAWT